MSIFTISTIYSGEGMSYSLLDQDDRSVISEITKFCYKAAWVDNGVHPTLHNYIACFTEGDRRKLLREGSL